MRNSESGNAIFYIFVAIVLLAALSFAVAEGSRSSGKTLNEDRARLAASEIISYGDALNKAAGMLRLRGIAAEALSFAHPDANATYGTYGTNPAAEIFHPEGGGITYRLPPDMGVATAGTPYLFTGSNQVENIGSVCGTAVCSELLMLVPDVRLETCQLINKILGYSDKNAIPVSDNATDMTLFAGTFANVETLSDEDPLLMARSAGCYRDQNTSKYIYYQVLIAR
ncbi:MAG: hypothetical protein NDJ24_00160 [Alphaproteobacteria bacterium]|nr:hypothetical protein [Alphaproteobacteria bacterium]